MSDKDSLFGSPPPSPARGRSPSLALPESSGWRLDAQTSSQNVGTIALPGSQRHSSELPVFLNPALPSETTVLQLRPPAQTAKPQNRRHRSTSHTVHSTSRIPPPAPDTSRTDRTLRDLVGLISHFEPVASPSSSRPPPITIPSPRGSHPPELYPPGSAQNPIEIDAPGPADAVNSALIALAGTVASALKLPTAPQETPSLSKPTVNNVLHCIKHDPKLIPALQATYEYLGSIPKNSQPPPRSFSHVTTNQPDPSSASRKKRKRKYSGPQVPAGAGHWDIPFPFAPGREPKDYPSKWHLERGRRVLGELLGLFERGFAKARGSETASTAKTSSQRQPRRQRVRVVESVPGCGVKESTVGIIDEGSIPGAAAAEGGGLDYQRMADWLSSVPPPPSSSIMDSMDLAKMPSPSPSDPAPMSSNSLLDFLATLGPTFSDALPPDANSKEYDFDYAGAFDELYAGVGDETTWRDMPGSGPTSQAINDIMEFSIPELQSPTIHTGTQELALDPTLTPSQQQVTQPFQSIAQVSQAIPASSGLPMDSQDPAFKAAASDALVSLMQSAAGSSRQRLRDRSVASGVGTELDWGDSAFLSLPFTDAFVVQHVPAHAAQSVDAHSLLTVPTASGSSSQCGSSTPTANPQDSMSPVPSLNAGLLASGKTKVERRAAILARAREYREQVVKELERIQVQRWELLIEGGVLRNLEKASVQ